MVLASVEIKRRHLKRIYQYLSSQEVEEYDSERKSRIMQHSLRILKIFYHYIENKLMRPNVYYTFPKEASEFRFSVVKTAFKIKTEENFCFAVWVFLNPADTDKPRNIVALLNQDGEGVKLQFHQGKLHVIASSGAGSPVDRETAEQSRSREVAVLSTGMTEGIWTYITMAYENRNCSRSVTKGSKIGSTCQCRSTRKSTSGAARTCWPTGTSGRSPTRSWLAATWSATSPLSPC